VTSVVRSSAAAVLGDFGLSKRHSRRQTCVILIVHRPTGTYERSRGGLIRLSFCMLYEGRLSDTSHCTCSKGFSNSDLTHNAGSFNQQISEQNCLRHRKKTKSSGRPKGPRRSTKRACHKSSEHKEKKSCVTKISKSEAPYG